MTALSSASPSTRRTNSASSSSSSFRRVGAELDQGDEGAVIESVKAAGELKIPVSGTVTEVNDSLVDEPGQVNADPLGDGWFFRIQVRDASELDGLMNEAAYQTYVESLD